MEEPVYRHDVATGNSLAPTQDVDALQRQVKMLQDQLAQTKASERQYWEEVQRLSATASELQPQVHGLEQDVERLTRLYFTGSLLWRLLFHRSGVPRKWLRLFLLADRKGTPRPLARRLLLKTNGQPRPIFAGWYRRYDTEKPQIIRQEYSQFLSRLMASGALAQARTLHIVTTPHTNFIGEAMVSAMRGTRLDVSRSNQVPDEITHDLYIVVAPQMFDHLPPAERTIMVQMEQVRASRWVDAAYLERLGSSLAVLDYAHDNIAALIEDGLPAEQLYYLPVRPEVRDIAPNNVRDIDVLFYGSAASERRMQYIKALSGRVNLRVETDVFGPEMSALLERAKIVVNIHFYENALLETTRISEALSHGAHVISEDAVDQAMRSDFNDLVTFVPRDDVEAFVAQVEAALAQWNGPCVLPQNDGFAGLPFHLLRALHGCGILSLDELQAACAHMPLPSRRLVLTLPEHQARYDFARANALPGAMPFHGLRHIKGWKGCALSYKFMATQALRQGLSQLVVYEEDAKFPPHSDERLNVVERYLLRRDGEWDVFSGLLTDLSSDSKVSDVQTFEYERFIHINKVIGMVFGIYSASALELISRFEFQGNDRQKHTIDRYLEALSLRCVTTVPSVVLHHEGLESSLWNVNNRTFSSMIDASVERLELKSASFDRHNGPVL